MSDGADEVVTFAFRELAANYASFAGAAVYLYDILLTFDDEVIQCVFTSNNSDGGADLILLERERRMANQHSLSGRTSRATLYRAMKCRRHP